MFSCCFVLAHRTNRNTKCKGQRETVSRQSLCRCVSREADSRGGQSHRSCERTSEVQFRRQIAGSARQLNAKAAGGDVVQDGNSWSWIDEGQKTGEFNNESSDVLLMKLNILGRGASTSCRSKVRSSQRRLARWDFCYWTSFGMLCSHRVRPRRSS